MMIRAGIAISIKDTLFIRIFCISGTHPTFVQAILANAGIWHHNIMRLEGTSGEFWLSLILKETALRLLKAQSSLT